MAGCRLQIHLHAYPFFSVHRFMFMSACAYTKTHPNTGHIRALHMPMEEEGYMERGLVSLEECLRIRRLHFPEYDFNIANTRKMLGLANKRRGMWHEAREHLEACLPGFIQYLNINHHHVQFLTLELVAVLMELDVGKYYDAIDLISTSLANALIPRRTRDDYTRDSPVLDLLYRKYECFAKACRLDDRIDDVSFEKLRQTFDEISRELTCFGDHMKEDKRYIDIEEGLRSIEGSSTDEDHSLVFLSHSKAPQDNNRRPAFTRRQTRKWNRCYPFL